MKLSPEIRRAIYATNAIESQNFTLQRNLKARLSFPHSRVNPEGLPAHNHNLFAK